MSTVEQSRNMEKSLKKGKKTKFFNVINLRKM